MMKASHYLSIFLLLLLYNGLKCDRVAAAAAVMNCTLPLSALGRFKYVTFYSWHLAEGNWTTLGESQSLEELTSFHELTARGGMLELQQIFFQTMQAVNPKLKGLSPRPDGAARWAALLPAIRTAVVAGAVQGFFLGDELVWNNITWDVLNSTASLVKAAFPDLFVYYNEGGAPLYAERNINGFHSPYPYVPASVDYISTDDYDDMWIPKGPRWFYESFLYGKMNKSTNNKQKVFVVPPVYAWLNDQPNVTWWDDQELRQAQGYLAWVAEDDRIVGINGFHMSSYFPDDLGLVSLPRTLSCYRELAAYLIALGN